MFRKILFPVLFLLIAALPGNASVLSDNYDSIARRIVKIKSTIPVEYNQYVQLQINEYLKNEGSSTNVLIGKGLYLFPEMEKLLKKYRLPAELKFLAAALSGLENSRVSQEGSSGIWQIKYHVAKTYGLKINSYIDERRDPIKATEAASRYFEDLYKIYEDWNLVMAAYYASPLEVNKAIRQSGGKLEYWKIHGYLSADVQMVVPRFIATLYLFNHFRDHKLAATVYKPIPTDTVAVKNWTTFEQINKVVGIEVTVLKEYNPVFKKNIIPFNASKYYIKIPVASVGKFKELDDSLYVFKDKEPGLVTMPDNRPKPAATGDSLSSDKDSTDQASRDMPEEQTKPKPKTDNSNLKGQALITYTVKKGDGLGKIASRYDCTISEIKKWNKLKSNTIRPGQKLKIYVPKSQLSKYKRKK